MCLSVILCRLIAAYVGHAVSSEWIWSIYIRTYVCTNAVDEGLHSRNVLQSVVIE